MHPLKEYDLPFSHEKRATGAVYLLQQSAMSVTVCGVKSKTVLTPPESQENPQNSDSGVRR